MKRLQASMRQGLVELDGESRGRWAPRVRAGMRPTAGSPSNPESEAAHDITGSSIVSRGRSRSVEHGVSDEAVEPNTANEGEVLAGQSSWSQDHQDQRIPRGLTEGRPR